MKKVFIDGSAGTTGLRIRERLHERKDLQLVILPEELRKDASARKDAINSADVVFLCLPDAAAKEAVLFAENPNTAIIDTSTAHRTADGWTYGFPEIADGRAKIAASKRVANPGCHASGFIALIEPLVRSGIVKKSAKLFSHSLTGFSGGGKKMIADYEESLSGEKGDETRLQFSGGRQYALSQSHKHLPEIVKICGLETTPIFCPIVVPHMSGMETTVTIFKEDLKGGIEDIKNVFKSIYPTDGLVKYDENLGIDGFVSSACYSGRDDMAVGVFGNDDRISLVSVFDNLGKGASGSAIQNMNIILGCSETEGLIVA
jgi:N-acetyl-gamma-glutamyl-phosphate reductase